MVGVSVAPASGTKLFVDPDEISGLAVDDTFTIDIKISGAKNIYSYGFTIDYAPYMRTIVPINFIEGEFLPGGPFPAPYVTFFSKTVDNFGGKVTIGATRMGDVPGAYGDGILASITFKVVEAGESPLDLVDTELYERIGASLEAVPHQTWSGFYHGPVVKLVHKQLTARDMSVGETLEIYSSVKNLGDVPLYAYVVFDMMREDLTPVQIGAGQSYSGTGPELFEYLYANEYTPFYEWDWTNPGASVFGEPDGDYTESEINGAMTSEYGFEDISLGGRLIGRVDLEGYTQCGSTAPDIDMYCVQPYTHMFNWFGSLWGTTDWGWHGVRWVDPHESVDYIVPPCATEAGLNGLTMLIYNYYGDAPDFLRVDALRLKVTFSKKVPVSTPIYTVQPNENLHLDPATWDLTSYDVGKYHCNAYVYYSLGGQWWIRSDEGIAFTWWVK
jgi:hypothetical protein